MNVRLKLPWCLWPGLARSGMILIVGVISGAAVYAHNGDHSQDEKFIAAPAGGSALEQAVDRQQSIINAYARERLAREQQVTTGTTRPSENVPVVATEKNSAIRPHAGEQAPCSRYCGY